MKRTHPIRLYFAPGFVTPGESGHLSLRRLNQDLQVAREIQSRFLPRRLPHIAGLDYCGDCRPAGEVGGDFFDFRRLPGNALAVSVGDVSGHRIGAAILMSGIQALLRGFTGRGSREMPGVVEELNRVACQVAPGDPEAQLDGLDELKADINKVGSELQSIEAERDSLSEWEGKALDQILPLMHDAADNTEKAIQTFNSDRQRLWATSYVDDTARIYKAADHVATLLHDYLKLAKTREKESRIEQSLGAAQ